MQRCRLVLIQHNLATIPSLRDSKYRVLRPDSTRVFGLLKQEAGGLWSSDRSSKLLRRGEAVSNLGSFSCDTSRVVNLLLCRALDFALERALNTCLRVLELALRLLDGGVGGEGVIWRVCHFDGAQGLLLPI